MQSQINIFHWQHSVSACKIFVKTVNCIVGKLSICRFWIEEKSVKLYNFYVCKQAEGKLTVQVSLCVLVSCVLFTGSSTVLLVTVISKNTIKEKVSLNNESFNKIENALEHISDKTFISRYQILLFRMARSHSIIIMYVSRTCYWYCQDVDSTDV